MTVLRLALVLLVGAFVAPSAMACRVVPPPLWVAWPSAPDTSGPNALQSGEIALEVRYERSFDIPASFYRPAGSSDVIIVGGCYAPQLALYRVVSVVRGHYYTDTVLVSTDDGLDSDAVTEHSKLILVGRMQTLDGWTFLRPRSPPACKQPRENCADGHFLPPG